MSKLILRWVLHDMILIVLSCLFPPAEKPAAEQNTQPSRLSASSSSSDSSSSSSSSSSSDTSDSDSGWEAEGFPSERGPESFASHQVDWTAVELLTMEPQDGSEETSTRQNWSASTSVKERERWGFPCAHLIHPILSWTQKSWGWMERRRLTAVLWRTGCAGRWEGCSISCREKEMSEACVGGLRVLEPESVSFLEIISLLPVLSVLMLYRWGVQLYKYLFFFYKEAFYG